MKARWQINEQPAEIVEQLRQQLDCSAIFARILANRNFTGSKHALAYLNPSLSQLQNPFSVRDMDTAVRRITAALTQKQKVLVFGDYDVDGITATALLVHFLRQIGVDVRTHIPHRTNEGYGLQPFQIDSIVIPQKIDLMITVDCGSTNHEAIGRARAAGVDVVVTDHHNISEPPADAVAVVNPKRADCNAGFEHLAGVGVAFILLVCLRKHLRDIGFWESVPEPNLRSYCDLVALGSIADSVPLIGDNRILTRAGLQLMQQERLRPGIGEIFKLVHIDAGRVNEEDLAYRVVPRLNAAGRMDHASAALDLLMATDPDEARPLAGLLHDLNARRKNTENDILDQIRGRLRKRPELLKGNSLVLAQENWHEGVIGIVAARLTEQYHRPVVIISIRDGLGKGSGRSIPGIDLHRALKYCAENMEGFGGHAMAAGLQIKGEKIEAFKQQFDRMVEQEREPEDDGPVIPIDAVVRFHEMSDRLINEIQTLQPFGQENREPILMAEDVSVVKSQVVGERHLKLWLNQPHPGRRKTFQAIWFNVDPEQARPVKIAAMAFRLQWNYWNGRKNAQLVVKDIRL